MLCKHEDYLNDCIVSSWAGNMRCTFMELKHAAAVVCNIEDVDL